MAETGMNTEDHVLLLQTQAARLLEEGTPESYPRSLAAATRLTAERLDAQHPAAGELAVLCAFLGPEPIPEWLFTAAPGDLPRDLASRTADPLAWRQTLGYLTRRSLARVDQRGLVMHRLTQAVLRDRLSPAQAAAARSRSEAILAASNPHDSGNPATWPRWARLMPHLLAADLAATSNPDLREIATHACDYLLARGDTTAAHNLASDLRLQWAQRLGGDHEHTLIAATHLARALSRIGRHSEARDLDQDILNRRRRLLGDDHPETLRSAGCLAIRLAALGEMHAAADLAADTLGRRRRVLGDDHPDTLAAASDLAISRAGLGELEFARDLDQDTLSRRRRVLGEDHPHTLRSAGNLAARLAALGELQTARDMARETLSRCRRVLGDEHPNTLTAASDLARYLAALGGVAAARDLEKDTLGRRRRILGDSHPDTLTSASNLANYAAELDEQPSADH